MNNPEDFSNRGALLGELAIDRCVTALDALTHAQKLTVVTHASDLQVHLPSAYIDYLLQLIATSSQHTNPAQKPRPGGGGGGHTLKSEISSVRASLHDSIRSALASDRSRDAMTPCWPTWSIVSAVCSKALKAVH